PCAARPGWPSSGRGDVAQETVHRARRPQPDDPVRREASGEVTPVAEVRTERVADERLAAPVGSAEALPIVVPQLLVPADAPVRAPPQAGQPDPDRQIEPDDRVGVVEDEGADLPLIHAIDHPAVADDDRLHELTQAVVRDLGPVRAVDERIELEERDAEPLG